MTDKTKDKIISLVKTYKELMPDEYNAVKSIVKEKRNNQIKGGDMTGVSDYIERPICEYSEVLADILTAGLSVDELNEFKAKDGTRWFARRFNEFSLVEKI